MTVQVLVATMNQKDYSLLEKMNIQTDAIVGNQCDKNEIIEFDYKGNKIKWLSFAERGVGLNRNNTLMRATADICVFADDDVVYVDGFKDIITNYYKNNAKADVVIFNFKSSRKGSAVVDLVIKDKKLNHRTINKFGAFCITAKNSSISMANVNFNRNFGGGSKYGSGEDTLFLSECLNKKLKIYACSKTIGKVNHQESTWYNGITDKLFFDRGVLYSCLKKRMAKAMAFYHCLKHRKAYKKYGWLKAYKMMKKGIKSVII